MLRPIAIVLAAAFLGNAAQASTNKPVVATGPTAKAAYAIFTSLNAQENQDGACPRTIINGTVEVRADTNDGGGLENFAVNAWDDGNFRDGVGFTVPVGETRRFAFQIIYAFPILQGAAGVGVYLEDAVGPAATTTYDSVGSLQGPLTTACPAVGTSIQALGAASVPTLGPLALGLLAAALGVLGLRARRRRS